MPNNYATIVFYDDVMNPIYQIEGVVDETYRLTQSQWDYILSHCNSEYSIRIIGEQRNTPYTGPYYSGIVTFSAPAD